MQVSPLSPCISGAWVRALPVRTMSWARLPPLPAAARASAPRQLDGCSGRPPEPAPGVPRAGSDPGPGVAAVIRDQRRARRSLGTFGAPLALVVCTLIIALSDQLWRLDYLAYNGFLRAWQRMPAAAVVIVAIDEPSLARIGRWPWSRRVDAELIERLTEAGASVIGLEFALAEPASDDPAADAALARAIEAHGRVVLPVIPSRLSPAGQVVKLLPMADLPAAAASLGHTEIAADPDGIVRRHYLEAGLGVPYWPSLSLAMLQLAGSQPGSGPAGRPGRARATARPALFVGPRPRGAAALRRPARHDRAGLGGGRPGRHGARRTC